MPFASNLRRLRLAAKMTQEQLALACGWSGQSRIANYETTGDKSREPKIDDVPILARALGVPVSQFFDDPGPAGASQSAGLDAAKLTMTTKFLEDLFDARGLAFVASEQVNLIASVYAELMITPKPNLIELGIRFGNLPGNDDERQSKARSTGQNDRRSTAQRSTKAKTKARPAR